MSDRFFLICNDDRNAPLVELVGVKSTDEFTSLLTVAKKDRALEVLVWGIVIDSDALYDARSLPPSDFNFILVKVLLRRLLHHVRPHRFDPCNDSEKLRKYLRHVWRIS